MFLKSLNQTQKNHGSFCLTLIIFVQSWVFLKKNFHHQLSIQNWATSHFFSVDWWGFPTILSRFKPAFQRTFEVWAPFLLGKGCGQIILVLLILALLIGGKPALLLAWGSWLLTFQAEKRVKIVKESFSLVFGIIYLTLAELRQNTNRIVFASCEFDSNLFLLQNVEKEYDSIFI